MPAERPAPPRTPVYFTRKFPPSVGGMETLAAGVWRGIESERPDSVLIAYGGPNRALPRWLPGALALLAGLLARRRAAVVLAGDALAYAIISPLLALFRVPRATMIMGLDVTYANPVYRAVVLPVLRRAPLVLAISSATADLAAAAGVARERLTVVRLGVAVPAVDARSRARAGDALRSDLGLGPDDVVLLTLGRLVRRKGARWFVETVLPALPAHVHYVIAGSGEERDAVLAAANAAGVAHRVHLLGAVDDERREQVMTGADLFVQPNIAVPGDAEGFGLVTVEAAVRAVPVVAADLEGLRDAVVDGRTGLLLPSGDAGAWIARLTDLVADRAALTALGARFAPAAAELYGEHAMGRAICAALGVGPVQ